MCGTNNSSHLYNIFKFYLNHCSFDYHPKQPCDCFIITSGLLLVHKHSLLVNSVNFRLDIFNEIVSFANTPPIHISPGSYMTLFGQSLLLHLFSTHSIFVLQYTHHLLQLLNNIGTCIS